MASKSCSCIYHSIATYGESNDPCSEPIALPKVFLGLGLLQPSSTIVIGWFQACQQMEFLKLGPLPLALPEVFVSKGCPNNPARFHPLRIEPALARNIACLVVCLLAWLFVCLHVFFLVCFRVPFLPFFYGTHHFGGPARKKWQPFRLGIFGFPPICFPNQQPTNDTVNDPHTRQGWCATSADMLSAGLSPPTGRVPTLVIL